MKRLRRVLISLLVLAITTFGVVTWLASSRLICPPRRTLQDYHHEILASPHERGLRIEAFTVGKAPCLLCEPVAQPGPAVKGNKLRTELKAAGVNLLPWGHIKATLVLLHGHTGCKEDHLPVAERFCAAGFRCLLVDLPGHGQHPEPFASFGVREASLPQEVLETAARQFQFQPAPAALFGISQGGAIVLQAAARDHAPWFAVAELSSFASLDQVVAQQSRGLFGLLAPLATSAVTRLVEQRAGYTPAQVRPLDAAARLSLPVLIGHGEADTFVTPDQARELYVAAPSTKKQFLSIPSAGHSTVLITPAPVYATVSRFLLDALPR
jgi:alpha-beta hydrolase superfamily lysophospholipase